LEARSGQNDKGCGRKKAEPGEDFTATAFKKMIMGAIIKT
jgi:hypothetical protein